MPAIWGTAVCRCKQEWELGKLFGEVEVRVRHEDHIRCHLEMP